MKKLAALFLIMIYSAFSQAFAFSELYYVKNAYTDTIKSIVNEKFDMYDYNLKKYNPYYGVSKTDPSEYVVVILQQSGQNMFYYYQSNSNKKINNAIVKEFKRSGYNYEQSYNVNIISLYDNLARELIGGVSPENKYTFQDAPVAVPKTNNQTVRTQSVQDTSLRGSVAQIASGTVLNVYLQTPINTAQANKGDKVVAVLMQDVAYNGAVVFPQGSLINGTLTKATHASYGSRNGKVVINFDQLVTPDNKTYNITTEKIDFAVTNDGKLSRTATSVAVGAVAGALVGLLFAALSDGKIGKSSAIGAGVGAGSALIATAAERGVDAEIPSFTEMEIKLTSPVSVTVSY